jgi:membrane-bound lytic murein transglycosylase MltF
LKFPVFIRRSAAIIASLCMLALSSCQTPRNAENESSALRFEPIEPEVAKPQVVRDLDEIQSNGTLRVLLRNSSSSYHILRGQEYGFEYELAAALARSLNVRLEVVLPDSESSVRSQLNRGDVDVIAMPLEAPKKGPAYVAYTAP